LAFADFVLGGEGITGLKDVGRAGVVGHLVNSLISKKPALSALQQFEVQIFGQVDIARDVEKIVVAPTVDEKTRKNIEKFSKKTGVPVEFAVAQQVLGPSWAATGGAAKGSLVDEVKAEFAKRDAAATT
jgi:ketol-acid reductoisomerase